MKGAARRNQQNDWHCMRRLVAYCRTADALQSKVIDGQGQIVTEIVGRLMKADVYELAYSTEDAHWYILLPEG